MKIAQVLPDLQKIYDAKPAKDINSLGDLISVFLNIVFYAAGFLAFYYLVWGALSYIMAQGNKESLAKARARITWAIIVLMVVFLAFFIARFAGEIFPPSPDRGGLPF
ncbi:MAG: hypothetical protein UT04_C0005G0017 [Candidatus Daviesbacteria bacterium GW2011_GWF2_38_7]|nr:MAG: hypothetical protein UT04_C0005G0017 [Candidatus Daviesbacteria bacterium GW2011_GWF2_38_7]